MSLFEEIGVDSIVHEDEIFINARQFAWHIAKAIEAFVTDSYEAAKVVKFTKEAAAFMSGVVEGMGNINLLLSQGGVEKEFDYTIHTVEDLFNSIGEKND